MTPHELDATRRIIKRAVSDANLFTDEERDFYYRQAMTDNATRMKQLLDEVTEMESARWKEFKKQTNHIAA